MKIRQATLEDFDKIYQLDAYCYGFDLASSKERHQTRFKLTHKEQFCVEKDGQVVANARCIPFQQNIRGVWKSMAGIAMVTSFPENRRKGHIRELMNFFLRKMYKDGIAVSSLYPFKDTFYASFGYVNAPPVVCFEANPHQFKKWRKLPEGYSVIRMNYLDGFKYLKELHNKTVERIHGAVKRSEKRWKEYERESTNWLAVVFNNKQEPEGILHYNAKGFSQNFEWAPEGTMTVYDALALTAEARKALYHYIFVHADQTVKVKIPIYTHESDYYTWLSGYCHVTFKPRNIPMVRVINVEKALAGLPAKEIGEISIKVIDEIISENNKAYLLQTHKGQLSVKPTEATKATPEITIEGLSALIYGLLSAEELVAFEWLKKTTKKQQLSLDAIFPRIKLMLTEGF